MTITTRDIDRARAAEFFKSNDSLPLMTKYNAELDAELLSDWVKLGKYLLYREQGIKPVWPRCPPGASWPDEQL